MTKHAYSDYQITQIKRLNLFIEELLYYYYDEFNYDHELYLNMLFEDELYDYYKKKTEEIRRQILELGVTRNLVSEELKIFKEFYSKSLESEKNKEGVGNKLKAYIDHWLYYFIESFLNEVCSYDEMSIYLAYNYDIDNIHTIDFLSDNILEVNILESVEELPYFYDLVGSAFLYSEFLENFIEYHNLKYDRKIKKPINKKSTRLMINLSIVQLEYLYKMLTQKHQFINDQKTDKVDFINVFTKEYTEHQSRIYFNEETTQIAYIFNCLRDYSFVYKWLNDSKKFISKDSTILKSNNISSQLSKTIKQGVSVKNQELIDEIFLNIPKLK